MKLVGTLSNGGSTVGESTFNIDFLPEPNEAPYLTSEPNDIEITLSSSVKSYRIGVAEDPNPSDTITSTITVAGNPSFVTINEATLELVISTPESSAIGTYAVTVDLVDDNS